MTITVPSIQKAIDAADAGYNDIYVDSDMRRGQWSHGLQFRLGTIAMWRWSKVRYAFAKRKWREAYRRGKTN